MLFQQVESMLKSLAELNNISGYVSEIENNQKNKIKSIQKKTMGQLSREFVNDTFSIHKENKNEPKHPKECWLSIKYGVESDEETYENIKLKLDELVQERNNLIHHFLPKWDSTSYKNSVITNEYLDDLREKTICQINYLGIHIKSIYKARELLENILTSKDAHKLLFQTSGIQTSKLVSQLINIANTYSRKDGWVSLGKASSLIYQKNPDEIRKLKNKYGYKSLKKLMLATTYFDIAEEATIKGGTRVIYRLKV